MKKKRSRTSTPRSKTGCLTCRTRRIKCDEQKPSCRNCVRTGRFCDGYALSASNAADDTTQSLSITSYSIPFRIPGSASDRRVMHYFCVQGAADLAGFGQHEFWDRLVLQYSQENTAVKQAVIALSTMHLDHVVKLPETAATDCGETTIVDSKLSLVPQLPCSNVTDGEPTANSLMQYHKAIRYLRRYLETSTQPSVTVVLIVCILLHHFDAFRTDKAAAMTHLNNGLHILREHGCSPSSSPGSKKTSAHLESDTIAVLAQMLFRLDNQASTFDNSRAPAFTLTSHHIRMGQSSCIPAGGFKGIHDARRALDIMQNWIWHFFYSHNTYKFARLEDIPSGTLQQKQRLENQLDQWGAALSDLRHRVEERAESQEKRNELASVKNTILMQLVFKMFVQGSLPWNPSAFSGGLGSQAEAFLQLASELLPSCTSSSTIPSPVIKSLRSFASEVSLIGPLMLTALRTPDAAVKDRTIALLVQLEGRREGFFSGATALRLVIHARRASTNTPDTESTTVGRKEDRYVAFIA